MLNALRTSVQGESDLHFVTWGSGKSASAACSETSVKTTYNIILTTKIITKHI